MQKLSCQCGQILFCDNTQCVSCGRFVGFDPFSNIMLSFDVSADGNLVAVNGQHYVLCSNRRDHEVCNGAIPAGSDDRCRSCALNRTIPILRRKKNLARWRRLEKAKRRMISGLSSLGLVVDAANHNASTMLFDFLEDKRSHPDVLETFVSTGHKDGVITINVIEADDVQRVQQRELMGERYRTLLGHFRHEAGHFFYPLLVADTASFADCFGDPSADYDAALNLYYEQGPVANWESSYISAYASSHPFEDWAECFAHYLHIQDALETGAARSMTKTADQSCFEDQLLLWQDFSVSVNEVSRSLGQRDAYPFAISTHVAGKLGYVHHCISKTASRTKQYT